MKLTAADANELRRLQRKLDGLSGVGVTNSHNSISVGAIASGGWVPPGDDSETTVSGDIIAKITGNATLGEAYYLKRGTRNATVFDETAAGTLTLATYYDLPVSDDAVLINTVGGSGHVLSTDWVVCSPLGFNTDGGLPVYAFTRSATTATIDIYNGATLVKAGAEFIKLIATNGGSDILEFTADGDGVDLDFKDQTDSTYKGIFYNGTKFVVDVVRTVSV
jgi:hypothetical protein